MEDLSEVFDVMMRHRRVRLVRKAAGTCKDRAERGYMPFDGERIICR